MSGNLITRAGVFIASRWSAYLLLVLLVLFSGVAHAAEKQGAGQSERQEGRLEIKFNQHLLSDLGLDSNTEVFHLEGAGELVATSTQGKQTKLSGSLNFGADASDSIPGSVIPSQPMSLIPGAGRIQDFYLRSRDGRRWLRLDYGHIQYAGDRLESNLMDVKIADDLARAMGRPELTGLVIGEASLTSLVSEVNKVQGPVSTCEAPNWPSEDGDGADIAMTGMDDVVQTVRSNGRVAITPSAYFTNVGTTDVPWFAMFANPASDAAHCFDDGNGQCQPYGTDQGGKLVWSLYRLHEGRIEQLGRSAVKHAFNSVNLNCPCNFGRIVWQGCEDLYGVNTNANRDFLGPRNELQANNVLWNHRGSIFDQNSDDQCDVLVNDSFYGGQQCETSPADVLERRMHVAETDLELEGARYFVETWYLVRDDINVLNSMGFREVSPAFSGIWLFPFQNDFLQGPVVGNDSVFSAAGQIHSEDIDTPEGLLRLVSTARRISDHEYEYGLVLMNFDYDPAISGVSLSLTENSGVTAEEHLDGDSNPDNDWVFASDETSLGWETPGGSEIRWGVLGSFVFRSSQSPHRSTVTLTTGAGASQASLQVEALGPGGDVFFDSFEP